MNDDISDIAAFYDSDPAREDLRLDQFQLEFDLTWRFLQQYLPATGSVLEIGAATGRYTVGLAERGYRVTAVDLSPVLVEECRKRLTDAGYGDRVQCLVADARDLSVLQERRFDAVLLMGPLYHLILEADRIAVLREANERLPEGGIIISAFLSRFGVLADLLRNNPGWIENEPEVRSLGEYGRRPDDAPRGGFRGYFARVAEIAPLYAAAGFETLVVAGVEPVIAADDAIYNRLPGEQRQRWLDLLYRISAEPAIVGASRHLIAIGRKASHGHGG